MIVTTFPQRRFHRQHSVSKLGQCIFDPGRQLGLNLFGNKGGSADGMIHILWPQKSGKVYILFVTDKIIYGLISKACGAVA
jgi:hypothetical protein